MFGQVCRHDDDINSSWISDINRRQVMIEERRMMAKEVARGVGFVDTDLTREKSLATVEQGEFGNLYTLPV